MPATCANNCASWPDGQGRTWASSMRTACIGWSATRPRMSEVTDVPRPEVVDMMLRVDDDEYEESGEWRFEDGTPLTADEIALVESATPDEYRAVVERLVELAEEA